MPLLARVPPTCSAARERRGPPEISRPVNQLDLTATILDLAGAQPCTAAGDCRELDGRSLRAAAARAKAGLGARTARCCSRSARTAPAARSRAERGLNNFYDALRTKRYIYIELNRVNRETGVCDRPEYELYDLKQRPVPAAQHRREPGEAADAVGAAGRSGRCASHR